MDWVVHMTHKALSTAFPFTGGVWALLICELSYTLYPSKPTRGVRHFTSPSADLWTPENSQESLLRWRAAHSVNAVSAPWVVLLSTLLRCNFVTWLTAQQTAAVYYILNAKMIFFFFFLCWFCTLENWIWFQTLSMRLESQISFNIWDIT